jgi:hypothetical protein
MIVKHKLISRRGTNPRYNETAKTEQKRNKCCAISTPPHVEIADVAEIKVNKISVSFTRFN